MTNGWAASGLYQPSARWLIGGGAGVSLLLLFLFIRSSRWSLPPWADDLLTFAPIGIAAVLVLLVKRIAELSDLERGGLLPGQAVVIGLLHPRTPLWIYCGVALCQKFDYYGRSPEHWLLVAIVSPFLVLILLVKLGWTVFEFCQTRHYTARNSSGSSSLDQAQFNSLRRTRSRFAFCIFLYYIGNLLAVATVFANFYYSEMARRPGLSLTDPGEELRLAVSVNGAIANGPEVIRMLTEVMARSKGATVIEAGIPSGLGYGSRALYADAVRTVVAEAMAVTGGRIDPKGISFRHEHSAEEPVAGHFIAAMHIQDQRQPFASSTDSFVDAFYMSAITLVSMGLTENYPISQFMKFVVLLEEFVGALFFIVFLGGMVTSLSD